MSWWVWTISGIYAVGFAFFFWFNLMIGPVTLGLALFRAAVWPIFWATGWPNGTPLPME